jgi:hypothetical protein
MFGKLVPDQASNVTVILHYEDDAQPLHSISQLFDSPLVIPKGDVATVSRRTTMLDGLRPSNRVGSILKAISKIH